MPVDSGHYQQRKITVGPRAGQEGWYDSKTSQFMPSWWVPPEGSAPATSEVREPRTLAAAPPHGAPKPLAPKPAAGYGSEKKAPAPPPFHPSPTSKPPEPTQTGSSGSHHQLKEMIRQEISNLLDPTQEPTPAPPPPSKEALIKLDRTRTAAQKHLENPNHPMNRHRDKIADVTVPGEGGKPTTIRTVPESPDTTADDHHEMAKIHALAAESMASLGDYEGAINQDDASKYHKRAVQQKGDQHKTPETSTGGTNLKEAVAKYGPVLAEATQNGYTLRIHDRRPSVNGNPQHIESDDRNYEQEGTKTVQGPDKKIVKAGGWLDWAEHHYPPNYKELPKHERAKLEANEQLKYDLKKQFQFHKERPEAGHEIIDKESTAAPAPPSAQPAPPPQTQLASAPERELGADKHSKRDSTNHIFDAFHEEHGGNADAVSHGHSEIAAALADETDKVVLRDHYAGSRVKGAVSFHQDDRPGSSGDLVISHLGSTGDVGGVGKELMRHVVDRAVKKGVGISFESTPNAEKFYEKLGFRHTDPTQSKIMGLPAKEVKELKKRLGRAGRSSPPPQPIAVSPTNTREDLVKLDRERTAQMRGAEGGVAPTAPTPNQTPPLEGPQQVPTQGQPAPVRSKEDLIKLDRERTAQMREAESNAETTPFAGKVYTGGSGREGEHVTYHTTSRDMAQSYADMHNDRFGSGGAVHEREVKINKPAPQDVIERAAKEMGINNEHNTPASVFDTNLHPPHAVKKLLHHLKGMGYDGAVLDDIPYGEIPPGQDTKAYITFTGVGKQVPSSPAPNARDDLIKLDREQTAQMRGQERDAPAPPTESKSSGRVKLANAVTSSIGKLTGRQDRDRLEVEWDNGFTAMIPRKDLVDEHAPRTFEKLADTANWADHHYKKWSASLSEDDRELAQSYQEDGAVANDYLRTGSSGNEARDALAREQIAALDRMVASSKLPEAVRLYRGLRVGKDKEFKVGEEIADRGFVSTSLLMSVAEEHAGSGEKKVVVAIDVPKGTPAAYLSATNKEYARFAEMLLARGTSARVKSVEKRGDVTLVSCEIPPSREDLIKLDRERTAQMRNAEDSAPAPTTAPKVQSQTAAQQAPKEVGGTEQSAGQNQLTPLENMHPEKRAHMDRIQQAARADLGDPMHPMVRYKSSIATLKMKSGPVRTISSPQMTWTDHEAMARMHARTAASLNIMGDKVRAKTQLEAAAHHRDVADKKKEAIARAAEKHAQQSKESHWRDHPTLKRLGHKLSMRDLHLPAVQKHLEELGKLEPALVQAAVNRGIGGVFVGGAGVPALDRMEHLRGVRPRGWSEGKTWDNVSGCYNHGNKAVIAGIGEGHSASVVLHEFGHSLGDIFGLNNTNALVAHHARLFKRLPNYLQQDGPGGKAGRQELLAEGFADVIMNRDRAVKMYDEEFVKWVEDATADIADTHGADPNTVADDDVELDFQEQPSPSDQHPLVKDTIDRLAGIIKKWVGENRKHRDLPEKVGSPLEGFPPDWTDRLLGEIKEVEQTGDIHKALELAKINQDVLRYGLAHGGGPDAADIIPTLEALAHGMGGQDWRPDEMLPEDYYATPPKGTSKSARDDLIKRDREQTARLRSKEFKKWFGDWEGDPTDASKVVDKDGAPKKIYHGTGSKFEAFDKSKSRGGNAGHGFYFAENRELAESFADEGDDDEASGTVIEAYLNIRNPFVLESQFSRVDAIALLKKAGVDKAKEHLPDGDEVTGYDIWQAIRKVVSFKYPDGEATGADGKKYTYTGSTGTDGVNEALQKIGYDGLSHLSNNLQGSIAKPGSPAKGGRCWIAFEPNQIKSTDNRGTFNPASDNVYAVPPGQKSKAAIKFGWNDLARQKQDTRRINKSLMQQYGKKLTVDDTADLVGAPDDSTVTLGWEDDNVYINVKSEDLYAQYYTEPDGSLYVKNIIVPEEHRGKGKGTDAFINLVRGASEAGAPAIKGNAERSDSSNGYYTWARMGWDGPIPPEVKSKLPLELKSASNVSDLMEDKVGQKWWRKNGVSYQGTFDLSKGSRSQQILAKYLKERDAKTPQPNEPLPAPPPPQAPNATAADPTAEAIPKGPTTRIGRVWHALFGKEVGESASGKEFKTPYDSVAVKNVMSGVHLYSLSHGGTGGWYDDTMLTDIMHETDRANPPRVLPSSEVDTLVNEHGWTPMYRALDKPEQVEQFRTGKLYSGSGIYGNGTYVAKRRPWQGSESKALEEVRSYGPHRMRIAVPPHARVVSHDALAKKRASYYDELAKDVSSGKIDMNQYQRMLRVVADMGRFAALLNYDVIDASGTSGRGYCVILNRSMLAVQKENVQ